MIVHSFSIILLGYSPDVLRFKALRLKVCDVLVNVQLPVAVQYLYIYSINMLSTQYVVHFGGVDLSQRVNSI